ncbi:MAG: PhnD/SsuA/transferrin family substrate-binding protein [Bdellovibrionia bacterium]
MSRSFTLGAVAYAPKVVTIWEGFRAYFAQQNFAFDYRLFSNYETQVEALFDGTIDSAWNSPLAHLRSERIARAKNVSVGLGPMRDTDQDLTSVLVVRKQSSLQKISDLKGKTVGFGAIDSPQARLIPLDCMRAQGLVSQGDLGGDFKVRRFDVEGGKHGDHIGGERLGAEAVVSGEVDAAWMIDGNFQSFSQEGVLPSGETRILARTEKYDHCIFTMSPEISTEQKNKFSDILLGMKWSDRAVRPLLELEGLKEWRPGRSSGFSLLDRAVDDEKFYSKDGRILEPNYKY